MRNQPFRDQLRAIVANEAKPSHKFGHQVRLYRLAQEIGSGLTYDDDVVYAAIWLHDLGVFEGNRPLDPEELSRWDHVAYAIRRSNELLSSLDLPPVMVQHVAAVIGEHQPHHRPSSLEAVIARDADILEQLGSIAIIRTAAKLGVDTRFQRFSDVTRYLRQQLETLPEQLILDSSKALALPRQKILSDFLTHVVNEAGVHPDG